MAGSISSVSNGSQRSGNAASSRPPAQNDATPSNPRGATLPAGLTPQQQVLIAELAATDRHVRAHEQAHVAAAGASYIIATGPDGKQYVAAEQEREKSHQASAPSLVASAYGQTSDDAGARHRLSMTA